jgi:electron transport complex protein RnfD
MSMVMLALLPATLFGFYQFGWPAINLFVVTVASAVLFETVCLKLQGKPAIPSLADGSGILSAWLLALTLPPWAPWWIGVIGSACAIIIGKQIFGGLGQNVFNPAMLARVILLISFPVQMTTWIAPQPLLSEYDRGFGHGLVATFDHPVQLDAVSTASVLGHLKTELTQDKDAESVIASSVNWLDLALGDIAGSMGETSAALLLLGGLWLLLTRVIFWYAPVAMLLTIVLVSSIMYFVNPSIYAPPQFHLLSGGLILAAFFIVTDPVTSPNTKLGQFLFGIGCGLLIYVIRVWGSYPEGIGFAVLLMNACTPLIDHYLKPRIYGRTRRGTPLAVERSTVEKRR